MVAQGTTLAGRYRLDARIGAGGMGEVWRGEDVVLARTVAVKVLLPGRTDDPGFVTRFRGEARAMATINHPGVVDVYDYGVDQVPGAGAQVYLVMKFVDGEPLDRLLTRLGRIAPDAAMELIAQAASALHAVHEQGIVHRDIKPGNLLVRADGTLVLTDFGIARADTASRLTDVGMVLGTAAYCAPEQAEGAPVTPAVDIYALGVVAYECLAGQRPFDGDTPVTIALKHIREAPPPLPPFVPPAIRQLVERALSKDPARRFPDAAAMSLAAQQAVHGHPESAPPSTWAPEAPLASQETHFASQFPSDGYAPQAGAQGPPTGAYGPPTGSHSPPTGSYAPPTGSYSSPTGSYGAPGADTAVQGARGPGGGQPHGLDTGPAGGRGRRKSLGRGRAGVLSSVAVVAVLCVGGAAVALTDFGDQGDDVALHHDGDKKPDAATSEPLEPAPTRTKTPRPPKAEEVNVTVEPTRPTRQPSRTPTISPSASPSPSATPTRSPSPSASPAAKKKVPYVLGRSLGQARLLLNRAGLLLQIDVSGGGEAKECYQVVEQNPPAGVVLEAKKRVSVVVDPEAGGCEPPQEPSPTPTTTPTGKSEN
jgi:serine/threonine-protein kinase